MKKAEEYIKDMNFSTHLLDYLNGIVQPDAVVGSFKFRLFNTIKQVQIDAIEATVKRCAEESCFINDIYILQVADKLKKELL